MSSAFHLSLFAVLAAFVCPVSPSLAQSGKASDVRDPWMKPPVTAEHLHYESFKSREVAADVSYLIYIPGEYEAAGEKRFPVIYWLHGIGGGQQGVPGMVQHFDEAIRAGKMPPALVVFVNGLTDSMWCDSKDGRAPVETVFIRELIPHIDENYRTLATREGRLIEGFSMGGFGAARLGFKHHDLFGAISLLAGALHDEASFQQRHGDLFQKLFGGDVACFQSQSPWTLAEQNAAAGKEMKIRQVVGDRDITLQHNRDYDAFLTKIGIPHTFTLLPGIGHSPGPIYDALGEENWKFYSAIFGKVSRPPSGTVEKEGKPDNVPAGNSGKSKEKFAFEQFARRHDRNGDGVVTKEEFSGPSQFFERLDADADGSVTAEEFEKWHGPEELNSRKVPR